MAARAAPFFDLRDAAATGHRAIVTHTARIAAFQTAWAPATVEVTGDELPLSALEFALNAQGWCLLTGPVVSDRRAGISLAALDTLVRRCADFEIGVLSIEADGSKMRPVKAPGEHEPVVPAATTVLMPVMGLDALEAEISDRWVHRPEQVRQVLGLPEDELVRLTPAMAARLMLHAAGGAKARPAAARLAVLLNKADDPTRLTLGRLTARTIAGQGELALIAAAGELTQRPVLERWAPVAAILLAAGAATRMGRPKQVEIVDGQPMVVRAVLTALDSGVDQVIVVTGAHAELVNAALAPLREDRRVQLVHNLQWASGQASSMHLGLATLRPAVEAALFMPVDQPYLTPLLLRRLLQAWRKGAPIAAPQVAGLLRGAPAIFDGSRFATLLGIRGDVGGRALLQSQQTLVTPIPADPAWLHDIDQPDDLI
ncbi:MAG: putative selenium-dependent hydroxylase accessory protein YqeC [Anaerolineales bacterium]|nr:putative selenium-dependent hydroxylase accessory protein YqeC [Anaerolineales bacterium]